MRMTMPGGLVPGRSPPPRSTGIAAVGLLGLLWALAGPGPVAVAAASERAPERLRMVETIRDLARESGFETGREVFDPRLLEAMSRVLRHRLVPDRVKADAYADRPLPIGHGQTISQPFIVALMTDLARPRRDHKVLEIGTGSGYQAAVLAELVAEVYTIEIVEPLAASARAALQDLGYGNVHTRVGDGYFGWEDAAPFDAILVTAAASHIPPPLVRQLKPGARMVVPVGHRFTTQHLTVVEKDLAGGISTRQILPVAFVPLTGER